MRTIFVSDAVHDERLAFGVGRPRATPTRRQWHALSALYRASLVACGYGVANVLRPEIYQTDVARQVCGVSDGDWHLAVKPIEHLRLFHGIPNVFVCDWPFYKLLSSRQDGLPFADQVGLLNKADAVACCTPFAAGSLRDAGVERVVCLPPYIPPRGRTAPRVPANATVFLAVADSDGLGRRLGPTMRGFARAHARHGKLRLIVRVVGDAEIRREVVTSLAEGVPNDTITVVFDTEAGSGVGDLLDSVDFFLWCDSHLGLSLPLVEAMMAGVPIVTTMTSPMGSFLTAGSAVPIATETVAVEESDEPMARFVRLTCDMPTETGIRDAILAAVDLDDPTRATMIAACRQIAERHFGLAAFQAGLVGIEDYLGRGRR